MRAKIGDVVIDKTYNKKGNLAIVVGEGISQPILIYHKGDMTTNKLRDYYSSWDGLEVIGHIDLEKIWGEAVRIAGRKTEAQKCETCEHYDAEVESIACERCLDGKYSRYEPKDEPQTDDKCKGCIYESGDSLMACVSCQGKVPYDGYEWDEPQTEGYDYTKSVLENIKMGNGIPREILKSERESLKSECEIIDCDYHDYCKRRGQTDCSWK